MRLKFEVTQEDIEVGVRNNCEKCPVGRAVTRGLKKLDKTLYYQSAETFGNVCTKTKLWKVKHPRSVQRFISKFDSKGVGVKPFKFFLDINIS